MALLHSLKGNIYKNGGNIFKRCAAFTHSNTSGSDDILNEVKKSSDKDMPIEMKNPYAKKKPKCILCQYDIEPNFKNVRLLSQFVSSYTGRIYGRHITGLCEHKHNLVNKEIKKAQELGLMGYYEKDPNFLADPDLYDPTQPFRIL